jgi:FtsP/CotA-like multicopper oxidase with cupredoxin domain
MAHDAGTHMAGLVLGIAVRPRPDTSVPARMNPRRLHLFVQEGMKRSRAPRAMGFVLQRDGRPPAPDSVETPGSALVLTRGQPTDIVIVNRLKEPTAIHWHGIELESYSDGVAGWSGAGDRLAPSVMPGDSFTARLTLPRTGTFMYHTHLNDIEQLTSGLYGALIVLEPGEVLDPARDQVFVAGWDHAVLDAPPHLLVNGDSVGPPITVPRGATLRLRFINIGPAAPVAFEVRRDTVLTTWRARARDGADLPPHDRLDGPARHLVNVGMTADFEFTSAEPGEYVLTAQVPSLPVAYRRRIIVR